MPTVPAGGRAALTALHLTGTGRISSTVTSRPQISAIDQPAHEARPPASQVAPAPAPAALKSAA